MSTLVEKARAFALAAHQRFHRLGGQRGRHERRLEAIAEACGHRTNDEVTLALAWVYDVVENTAVTFGELERELGRELADLVAELTPVSRPGDGTEAARTAIDRSHLARASARAKTVKLAELLEECRFACRPDSRATLAFVDVKTALLGLLAGGDPVLFDKAKSMLERVQARAVRSEAVAGARPNSQPDGSRSAEVTLQAAFLRAFSAQDVAAPLLSYEAESPLERVSEHLRTARLEVVGIRRGDELVGFIDARAEESGSAGERARPLRADQVVGARVGLSDVVIVLARHDHCFVVTKGQPAGVVTRGDMQKPVARMWLFGIITLAEMEFARRLRALWPDAGFHDRLSPGRLEKARALHAERRRRGQHVDLVDCLQLSDKAQILMTEPAELSAFGFESTSVAKRVARELESLRNNLAHAQDIVAYDWPQIIRLAWRVLPATTPPAESPRDHEVTMPVSFAAPVPSARS